MPKLNQIIAVESGVKTRTNRAVTDAYHLLQKSAPMTGISRTYQPRDEEGEQLPPESTRVQIRVQDIIDQIIPELTRLFDVVATKDAANTMANADVTVDGQTLLTAVPVTTLLFLEKQLNDLSSFVARLPILAPSENWKFDDNQAVYASDIAQTHRTKKIPRAFVKYPATDKHPAQVDTFTEDVVVGIWSTVKFSGALPVTRVRTLMERVVKLQDAVKAAREQANSVEVDNNTLAAPVLGFLFAE